MPQTQGYDPFEKVKSIEESGHKISDIMVEARKAEEQLQKQRMAQKGAMVLHDVINKRIGDLEQSGNKRGAAYVNFAPFLDPVVNQAAAMLEPVSKDYVSMLRGVHSANVKLLEPKLTSKGIVQFDPEKGQYVTQKFEKTSTKVVDKPMGENKYQKHIVTMSEDGTVLSERPYGEVFTKRMGGYGYGGKSKTLSDLEIAAETQMQNFKNEFADVDIKDALTKGRFDLSKKNVNVMEITQQARKAAEKNGTKFSEEYMKLYGEATKDSKDTEKLRHVNTELDKLRNTLNKLEVTYKQEGVPIDDKFKELLQSMPQAKEEEGTEFEYVPGQANPLVKKK